MITSFGSTYLGDGDDFITKLSPSGSHLWRQQLGATQTASSLKGALMPSG